MLLRGIAWSRLRVFQAVLLETAVAISRLRMAGAREMHGDVARVADIEVPVWRPHDRNREFVAPILLNDIETASYRLTANRANLTRFLVMHGSG